MFLTFNCAIEPMSFTFAAVETLKTKRFWTWTLAGALIYLIPAAIRYATGSIIIPFLNWPGFWIDHFIPGNLSEKILVNAFFPGGAGAVAGEIFAGYYLKNELSPKIKYLARLAGAIAFVSLWSLFQLWGYSMSIYMSFSPASNLFESYFVFPINYVISAFSIFTPTIMCLLKCLIVKVMKK
jgi:hypothetical protein